MEMDDGEITSEDLPLTESNISRRNESNIFVRRRTFADISLRTRYFTSEFKRMFEDLEVQADETVFEEKVLDLIKFHNLNEKLIEVRNVRRIMRRCLPTMLVQRQISNSDVVAEFLKSIDRMHNRHPISLPLFMISSMNHVIPSDVQKDPAKVGQPPLSYFEYFLYHANKKRLTFRGMRLAQVVMDTQPERRISTLLYSNPSSFISLLQYEGSFLVECEKWPHSSKTLLAHALEFILFCGETSNLWDTGLKLKITVEEFPEYIKKMLRNFCWLLRTSPNWHTATLDLAGIDLGRHTVPIPDKDTLRNFLDALFPGMDMVKAKPASLKHSCRIVIRNCLSQNWELPSGVFQLGLPKIMEDYLNLVV